MKLRLVVLGLCVSLCASLFAGNQHGYPEENSASTASSPKKVSWPGYCEIEVINNSYDDVRVYGVFDDGVLLQPFNIYSFEAAHYISLFYYGYCHAGMNLYIDTWSGYHVYSGYTPIRTTIHVVPYLTNQLKAEISKK